MTVDNGGRINRRQFVRGAGLVAAGLAVPSGVAACAAGPSATGGGGKGGVLSAGVVDWLPTDFYVGDSLSNGLVSWCQMAWPCFIGGGGDGKGLTYRNGLASGYQVSADAITHTVTLRDKMKFHDGSPITADDVAANLRAAFFPKDPLRGKGSYLGVVITLGSPAIVKSVTARNPRTIDIVLTQPQLNIQCALAFLPILKPSVLTQPNYGTNVAALSKAGSGPFRLTAFQPGSSANFERFDGFFEEVLPDRINVQVFTDPGAMALALESGSINIAEGLAKADWDRLRKSARYRTVVADPSVEADLLIQNAKDPALANKTVRQALALGMNRSAYTKLFFRGGTAVLSADPIVNSGMAGYVSSLTPYPYDPDQARSMLASAGVKAVTLPISGPNAQAPITDMSEMMQAIAEDLSKIGVKMSVSVQDPTAFGNAQIAGQVQSTVVSPGGQPDPFVLFDLFFGQGTGYNPGFLSSVPSLTKLLSQAHSATTVAQRNQALQQIIQTTRDEALDIPISAASYSAMVTSNIHNLQVTGTALDPWNRASIS
jgi:ABC-type transport system substrate-binding protein